MGDMKSERLIFRVDPCTAEDLARRATSARMTISDYLRALIELPIRLRIECEDDEQSSGDMPPGPVAALSSTVNGDPILFEIAEDSVLIVTDSELRKLRIAIDRWGVNYNQAVHALNLLARRFLDEAILDREDKKLLTELLRAAAKSNERASEGIRAVYGGLGPLLSAPTVRMKKEISRRRRR